MRVLLIEDNEDDAVLIRDALSRQSGEAVIVEWADRLDSGLARAHAEELLQESRARTEQDRSVAR